MNKERLRDILHQFGLTYKAESAGGRKEGLDFVVGQVLEELREQPGSWEQTCYLYGNQIIGKDEDGDIVDTPGQFADLLVRVTITMVK